MKQENELVLFWFRRDLRLKDNTALFHALKEGKKLLLLFIFDDDILQQLPSNDHRVNFIYNSLQKLHRQAAQYGGGVVVRRGKPLSVIRKLVNSHNIAAVYSNADHEPYGINRDAEINRFLESKRISFFQFLDHMVMDKQEVMKPDGSPYNVFTPYSRRWRAHLTEHHLKQHQSRELMREALFLYNENFPGMSDLGIKESSMEAPPLQTDENLIRSYDQKRDFPAVKGTSRLGVHLRFGTLSIRELAKKAVEWNDTFLNELIWREFYAMILWHYPNVVTKAFKTDYDRIEWRNDEKEFEAWKEGKTGYPMVDAGMRQLSTTGYMHNRLRMVTASFLSKHLLVDWRLGEAWFAEKLFDYELSSNNGGWQWSAGTGCDAAPYFRIFNPAAQQKKFDPKSEYISKWVPESNSQDYPDPIVDHAKARERCLQVYKKALQHK